jgi:hypothetical protein
MFFHLPPAIWFSLVLHAFPISDWNLSFLWSWLYQISSEFSCFWDPVILRSWLCQSSWASICLWDPEILVSRVMFLSPQPQWHTYSNNATPNSATSWDKHIQNITFHSLAPKGLFKHMNLWGAIPNHSIMQNIFSPTSKVPIVCSSLNNVKSPKFNDSSEIYPIT